VKGAGLDPPFAGRETLPSIDPFLGHPIQLDLDAVLGQARLSRRASMVGTYLG
jgi:hypothetical protein